MRWESRLLVGNSPQQIGQSLGFERWPPGEQFEKDRAEAVNVARGRGVARAARRHFRCQIARRAHGAMRAREVAFLVHEFSQPEVSDEGSRLRVEEDVARFQITVQHAALVRVVCGIGECRHERSNRSPLSCERPDARSQAPAGGQLHCEPRQSFVVARFVDGQDGRVVEFRQRTHLDLEPFAQLGDGGGERQQHLDRDVAIRRVLPGAIHDAHATPRQFVADRVAGNRQTRTPGFFSLGSGAGGRDASRKIGGPSFGRAQNSVDCLRVGIVEQIEQSNRAQPLGQLGWVVDAAALRAVGTLC